MKTANETMQENVATKKGNEEGTAIFMCLSIA